MEAKVAGITYEIPVQVAIRKEVLQIGDRVAILEKNTFGDPKIHDGVIIGFEPFPDLPTVRVAFIEEEYESAKVRTIALNEKSEAKWSMVPVVEGTQRFSYAKAKALLQKQIDSARLQVEAREAALRFFEERWQMSIEQMTDTLNPQA